MLEILPRQQTYRCHVRYIRDMRNEDPDATQNVAPRGRYATADQG
ncbi:hypothetical protein [Pseudofrankia sp. DC12]|nr:hypothetical protein [Pseudofrankia sp. DC12]